MIGGRPFLVNFTKKFTKKKEKLYTFIMEIHCKIG